MQGDTKLFMNIKNWKKNIEAGSASIFIVIFFTLLIGVITTSFVNIVNQDQQQALNNDLSQSAYDAAKAGVADANRAIVYCRQLPQPDSETCLEKFNDSCEDVQEFSTQLSLQAAEGSSVKVGRNADDNKLDQSYTCAKVQYKTPSITLTVDNQKMRIIQLNSDEPFNILSLQWFDSEDAKVNAGSALNLPRTELRDDAKFANNSADWGGNTVPPVLKLQFVYGEIDGSINLESLKNNSRSAFLYPNNAQAPTAPLALVENPGRDAIKSNQPVKARCDNTKFQQGQLACQLSMFAPASIQPGQKAYLVISPIYNKATIKVEASNILALGDDPTPVLLEGYPTIDVTGRAGDLFRRVKTTIDLQGRDDSRDSDAPGFDFTKTLCKNFSVTNTMYIKSNIAGCN